MVSASRTLEDTVAGVVSSAPAMAALPIHARARILNAAAGIIEAEAEEIARLIVAEVQKPLKAARVEARRAAFNFRWAAAEAERLGGEWLPLDTDPAGEGRIALVRRFPRGACLFITPFNFPLNLAVHKVAPAIAVGAPFVLKPPPQAPKTARRLGEILSRAGLPEKFFAVLECSNEEAESLVKDERFAVLSFTGSSAVGWRLRALAGKKHVVLELGGNAAVLIDEDADLALAAARCAFGAFSYAGQICISTQRVLVAASVYERFKELFLQNVAALNVGDPGEEATDVGPMIDEEAARRVESWIKESGGSVLCGGARDARFVTPAVIEGASKTSKIVNDEAFGPVVSLEKIPSIEHGFAELSKSRYGLQAGIFTRDIERVLEAWKSIDVGGLIVNDVPTYRADAVPYGGNKDSGIGREGIRSAMEEFTATRSLVLKS